MHEHDSINDDRYRDLGAERLRTNDNQRRLLLEALALENNASPLGAVFGLKLNTRDVPSAVGLERRRLVVTNRYGAKGSCFSRSGPRYPKDSPRTMRLTDRGRELAKTLPALRNRQRVETAAELVVQRITEYLDAYNRGEDTLRHSNELIDSAYAFRKEAGDA